MFRNPKINRVIGYLIMFVGFGLFYKGFHSGEGGNGQDIALIIISLILVVGSFVFQIMTVRCPHCNCLLNIKLANIDICPNCGKNVEP